MPGWLSKAVNYPGGSFGGSRSVVTVIVSTIGRVLLSGALA